MFRQGQLAVHGLAILLGRIEAGISNRGKIFLHHAVLLRKGTANDFTSSPFKYGLQTEGKRSLDGSEWMAEGARG